MSSGGQRWVLLLGLVSATLGSAAPAAGQPTDDSVEATDAPPDESARTVVRAPPSDASWGDGGTTVTRDEMTAPLSDLPAVLDAQSGLFIRRLGGLGRYATLSIRGSTAEQVKMTLDGVPLNDADGGPVDLSTLPLGPLASATVFRGDAPIVFGGGAIGGLVALESRRLAEPVTELEVGWGSFGTGLARAFLGRGGDGWGAGLAVDYQAASGNFEYLDDAGTAWTDADDSIKRRRHNASEQLTTLLKGSVDVTPGVRLSAVQLFGHTDRELPGLGLFGSTQARLRMTRNLFGGRLAADLGGVQLLSLAYLAWRDTRFDDPLSELGFGADAARSQSLVPGVRTAVRGRITLNRWLALRPAATVAWRLESLARRQATRVERHILEAAGELAVDLGAAVQVSARLRAEAPFETSAGLSSAPQLSAGASVTLAANDHTTLRASYAGNRRLPSLFELHGDTGLTLGNPDLAPESSTQLELTLSHDATWLPPGFLVTAEVAAFVASSEQLIQFVQNAQHVARPENVDRARSLGAEVGLFAELGRHVSLRSQLTYLDARNDGEIAARRGNPLPQKPRWTAQARAEFTTSIFSDGELGVWAELSHQSSSKLDRAALITRPGHTLFAAGVWAEPYPAWRVEVSARNLADANVQHVVGYPLPGRGVFASLKWTPEVPE